MKLIIQSDDYGITKAQALGAIEGIRNGVITSTGFFANMPWAEEVYAWLKPYTDQISFGIDLNASTGPSLLGHAKLPTLTHEDGTFLGSGENRALDTEENNHDHLAAYREELYAEFDAQIQRYIALVGHKPDYIHNHAYGTKTTAEVTAQLGKKYDILTTADLMAREEVHNAGMGWYVWGGDLKGQRDEDILGYFTSGKSGIETSEKAYGYLICHAGYVDAEIFKLSSFNICRAIDLACMVSEEMKQWIKENQIEPIRFQDLPKEW